MKEDPELRILESLYSTQKQNSYVRQRDIAMASGSSLGMTNTVLKRLAQKGLIIIQRLNARNIRYAVTPSGVNEIIRRSYRYLKKTIDSISVWRDLIDRAITSAKHKGFSGIVLCGKSELDFLVEYSCVRHGMHYTNVDKPLRTTHSDDASVLVLNAENRIPKEGKDTGSEWFLYDILAGIPREET